MAQFELNFAQDLKQKISIRHCETMVFTKDNLSNAVRVELFNGSEPYSGGGTVSATAVRSDGITVPITNGSITGNVVTVYLTEAAVDVPGNIGLYVKLTSGDTRTTVLAAIFAAQRTETDSTIDPGTIIPSVTDLINAIDEAVDSIPPDFASLLAGIAPVFSASADYLAGAFVWEEGVLYRFTTAHPAGSWTGTDAVTASMGADFAGEIEDFENNIVLQQATQPTEPDNRIWFPSATPEGVEVPTYAEHQALENGVEQALVYGNTYPLPLTWEMGTIDSNYEEANNTNTSFARTIGYYTPQANSTLQIERISATAVICVAYNPDGTGSSRVVYNTGETQSVEYTLEYGKKYRFALYKNGAVIDRQNIESYATFEMGVLVGKIDIPQLSPELSSLYTKIEDVFANTDYYSKLNVGVTKTKSENTISWTATETSAYVTYNYQMLEGHQYAIYYDVTGTSPNTNYGFTLRLAVDSFVTDTLATLSQTTGADASGTFIFTVPNDGSGYPCFLLSNNVGQSISGDIYIYDITGLSASQINGIDFSQVGASKVFVFATGSSSGGGSDWSSKKVVFYGDSITQGNYPEKVQTALGFTLVKNAIGGSRFAQIASDPSINANALSSDTRIATLPADADVVCIMGGTNDFQYTPIEQTLEYNNGFGVLSLKAAVAHTIYGIQTQCPNARIYLLTLIGGRGDADPTVLQPLPLVAGSGSGQGKSSLDIRNAMIEVADYLNIPVIDTWSCGINGLNRNTTIKDTVHPTEKGNVMIADYIINALYNNSPN